MKKIVAFVLALVLVFSLAGAAMADEAKGADVKGTGVALTIYTNSGSSGRADWLKDRAAQDGVLVEQVSAGRAGRL